MPSIKYFEGYGCDEEGNIYNKNGSLKRLKVSPKGYLFTNFYYGGRLRTHQAHWVIARAWLGEPKEGYEVDHINNVRDDNRVANLQYLSKSQNNQKAYDSGNRMFIFGDTNPNSLVRKGNK